METKIAFDIDGTLIRKDDTGRDVPRYNILQLLFLLKIYHGQIYVWSGSGRDYAYTWCQKLGISEMVTVIGKGEIYVDIAIDDQECELGKVNIRV